MKKLYKAPIVEFEPLEIDSVMNAHPSQWTINVNNEAPDNNEEHGSDIGGSDIFGPNLPPEEGD
ncbi:MAG: hypothetical protein K6A78_01125 [Prevotella sp.]|jgi:hypothetical protein|nr:hypothetical protein [Prevotella sp.]